MKMNQSRLAEMAGISRASVTKAIKKKPSFPLAVKLGAITTPTVSCELWGTGTTKQKQRALKTWFEECHLQALRERDKGADNRQR